MSTTTTTTINKLTEAVGSLHVRASHEPLKRNGSLDTYAHFASQPAIGEEFSSAAQLSAIVNAPNADELIKDLAVLVAERGVVFFREQDLSIPDQTVLVTKLGELSGKPKASGLHIHPTTAAEQAEGERVLVITSDRRFDKSDRRSDRSALASYGWHSDVTFEPVPSDYACLKIHTSPEAGGDTLWASAYEVYSRLSPSMRQLLEGKEAYHEATSFKADVAAWGWDLQTGERGHPANAGDHLSAVHPVIRVNPVTGWKGLYVNPAFTKRILGVTRDESDLLLDYLFRLVAANHDAHVRFKWNTYDTPNKVGDIAIWDNRSTFHTATNDYFDDRRVGDRVISVGERPYYSKDGRERREALGLPPFQYNDGSGYAQPYHRESK